MAVCGSGFSSHPFLLFHMVTCQPFGKHTGCLLDWLFSCTMMCCEERNRGQRARDMGTCLFAASCTVPQGGRTRSPFADLAPVWGASWSPLEQEVWPVLAVRVAGVCWIVSVHHHSSWHLCLGSLSWAVSPKGQQIVFCRCGHGVSKPPWGLHSFCYCLSTQGGKERWSVYRSLFIETCSKSPSLLLLSLTVQEGIGVAFPGSTWLWLGAKPGELLMQ